jgi:hypothetical protein
MKLRRRTKLRKRKEQEAGDKYIWGQSSGRFRKYY